MADAEKARGSSDLERELGHGWPKAEAGEQPKPGPEEKEEKEEKKVVELFQDRICHVEQSHCFLQVRRPPEPLTTCLCEQKVQKQRVIASRTCSDARLRP